MCQSVMDSPYLFTQYLLKDFAELEKDRIINVRMALCETLVAHWKAHQPDGGLVSSEKQLRLIVKRLKSDTKDVSDILLPIYIQGLDDELDDHIDLK